MWITVNPRVTICSMRVSALALTDKIVVASAARAAAAVATAPPKNNKNGDPLRIKDVRPAPMSRLVERGGVWVWNNIVYKMPFGLLPKGYNWETHGPYMHWRYYGKTDTAFKDVKLGEIPAWFARREKGLVPFSQLIGRAVAYHHWRFFDIAPFHGTMTIFLQWIMGMVVFWTLISWHKMRTFYNTIVPGYMIWFGESYLKTASVLDKYVLMTRPFIERPPSLLNKPDGSVLFECMVQSGSQPDVKWFLKDNELTADDRHVIKIKKMVGKFACTLIIKSPGQSDQGIYKVVATNSAGSHETEQTYVAGCVADQVFKD